MILGIGIDLHDIRHVEQNPGHYLKHFTAAERALCERREERWAAYTKRFAIKEAVIKALGVNDAIGGVHMREIEVVMTASGRPTVQLSGGAARQLTAITPPGTRARIDVSATDHFPTAAAMCAISAEPL